MSKPPSHPALRPTAAQLRDARRSLIENGGRLDVPLPQLDPRLARSWLRSSRAGLRPEGRSSGGPHASAAQLARALDRQQAFVAHAGPVMEYLFEQTRDSGSMVILADARGMLLKALGDAPFMSRAQRVALRPGAVWQETLRGTNAIGTALADGCATAVRGAEHYLDRNGFLACAAAPILDPGGRLLGVLDISGDQRHTHPHTLGLARAGARLIEQRLFDSHFDRALRLRFHRHAEGIATLTEGQLALAPDGWVLGANAVALEWLGLRASQLNTLRIEEVFDLGPLGWNRWRTESETGPRRLNGLGQVEVWARLDPSALTLEGVVVPNPLPDDPRTAAPPDADTDQPVTNAGPVSAPLAIDSAVARTEAAESIDAGQAAAGETDALAALDVGDAVMHRAVSRARRLCDPRLTLLLQGEAGVGKATFARAWHDSSARAQARFVRLRCARLAPGELATALHSLHSLHVPQTAASAEAVGTLFLDGVTELTPPDQAGLLAWLLAREERDERQKAGRWAGHADEEPYPTALVCSSRQPLAAAAAAGRFREDLVYRLSGLLLKLPPLRERSDLPALADRLLAQLSPVRQVRLAPPLRAALQRSAWPGNLHRFVGLLRTAVHLLGPADDVIDWAQLPDDALVDAVDAVDVAFDPAIRCAALDPAALDRAAAPQNGRPT